MSLDNLFLTFLSAANLWNQDKLIWRLGNYDQSQVSTFLRLCVLVSSTIRHGVWSEIRTSLSYQVQQWQNHLAVEATTQSLVSNTVLIIWLYSFEAFYNVDLIIAASDKPIIHIVGSGTRFSVVIKGSRSWSLKRVLLAGFTKASWVLEPRYYFS